MASFRRNQTNINTAQAAGELKPYAAFHSASGKPERMEIRRVLGETHAPSYRYLMDVAFNGEFGTELVLVYSFLMVKIKGRNLQPVIAAILENHCDFIQDFDAREFLPPGNPSTPVIEAIEIVSGREDREDKE